MQWPYAYVANESIHLLVGSVAFIACVREELKPKVRLNGQQKKEKKTGKLFNLQNCCKTS